MTFEEAKKILKKEVFGIRFKKFDKPLKFEEKLWIRNEKPEVLEALHIVAKNGIGVSVPETALRIRRLIIKKMKAGEGEPAPVSGTPLSAAEGMKLRWKDNKNTDKNPALAESATQFNDALLYEQEKKIEELTMENERLKDQVAVLDACKGHNDRVNRLQIKCLGKEIARLNGIIHDKNEEIKRKIKGCCELVAENVDLKEGLRKTESLLHDTRDANSRNLDTCFKNEDLIDELKKKLAEKTKLAKKYAKELSDSSLGLCKLEKKLKDKDAVLADVAEELRLSKIREKNLTEVCQKYVKEVEDLREELANKVVDKIDAQALKSAESALAWKEKVIAEKDEVIACNEKEIADLTHELKDKHKRYVWYKGAYLAAQQILNTIADYAAKHPDKKFSDQMIQDAHVECGTKVLIDKSVFEQIMKKAYGK